MPATNTVTILSWNVFPSTDGLELVVRTTEGQHEVQTGRTVLAAAAIIFARILRIKPFPICQLAVHAEAESVRVFTSNDKLGNQFCGEGKNEVEAQLNAALATAKRLANIA